MSMLQTGSLQLGSDAPTATSSSTATFTPVTFATPFPDGSKVIVVPMVQTFNGWDSPGLRIAEVTTTGFKIRINELHARGALSDGKHAVETIGWVAFTEPLVTQIAQPAQPAQATQVSGKGHSNPGEVVVANIGSKGKVFSGTFTGRSAFYGVDFVLGIYTDKEGRLSVVPIATETTRDLVITRVDLHNWTIQTPDTGGMGSVKYDPDTGNFCIAGVEGRWFQGELMGTYMAVV